MSVLSSPHGERRQVTVMFSDLVGSTELSAQLDPEDLHDIVTQYHQTAANAAKRFEGNVSQYMGDGVLILFGYPQAHEHDAERAVLAGLALLKEMEKLNRDFERKYKHRLAVRVGIHTGEVMIGVKAGDSGNLFGETPNIAARVQSSATPDSVCISASTHKLVSGFFFVDDLGAHVLKGVSEPVNLYKVIRASGVRGRLHNASRSSRTSFLGREEERNLLVSKWQLAQKGSGQLVMITGEAGIGKSRLLQQFKADLGSTPHTWIEGESSPYEQETPFAPTLDLVSNAFNWTNETLPIEKIDQLENAFNLVGLDSARAVPLLANLFNIEIPEGRFPPLLLSAEQRRTLLLQTLVDWVIGTARIQPTILVVEDLHFADPSTLEEFLMLSEQIETVPVLLVFTSRPRFRPPWPTRPFHSAINLARLDQDNVREMIEKLLGNLLPKETLETLIERTDGIPLFAEELSSAIAESRSQSAFEKQVPSTLQDLLMARLDFLGPIKEVAQICSVIGRDFSFSLLRLIVGINEQSLEIALARLVDSGLVVEKDLSTDAIYTFKHALVQEAAYSTLLKSRRRELHRAVAKAIKENFSEIAKTRPELVAQHLTQAGETESAIEAWQAAGELASQRAAFNEAKQHFIRALDLLHTLPESDERDYMELPIQLTFSDVLSAAIGISSEERRKAIVRAREISSKLGTSTQFLIVLLNLWGTTNSRSEITASREVANELLRLAIKDEGDMMLVWAYQAQTIEAYVASRFSDATNHFVELKKHYKHEEQTWAPFDPTIISSIHGSLATLQLGFPDQAREILRQQVEHAKAYQVSLLNVAWTHLGKCSLYINLDMPNVLLENAEILYTIGKEQQYPNAIAWGNIYKGIYHIQSKNYAEGIEQLSKAVGEYISSGTISALGEYLSFLAEGYAGMGEWEQALITINNAFGATPEEKMNYPKIHRVHGDILWMQPNPDIKAAEMEYKKSLDLAQEFGSRWQALLTLLQLGKLYQATGRAGKIRDMLAPLYNSFTEGFDLPTLQEAKAMLNEVS
jgi:class 3 adenylate cyclase/tetratricopeptide (TPR) repeat protein